MKVGTVRDAIVAELVTKLLVKIVCVERELVTREFVITVLVTTRGAEMKLKAVTAFVSIDDAKRPIVDTLEAWRSAIKVVPSPSKKRREDTRSVCAVKLGTVSDEIIPELTFIVLAFSVLNVPVLARTMPPTSKFTVGTLQLIPTFLNARSIIIVSLNNMVEFARNIWFVERKKVGIFWERISKFGC